MTDNAFLPTYPVPHSPILGAGAIGLCTQVQSTRRFSSVSNQQTHPPPDYTQNPAVPQRPNPWQLVNDKAASKPWLGDHGSSVYHPSTGPLAFYSA